MPRELTQEPPRKRPGQAATRIEVIFLATCRQDRIHQLRS